MKYFNTKNAILGIFWRALEWKMLIYFMAMLDIFGPLGDLMAIWYIFPILVYCTKKNMATQAESPEKMDFHIVKNMYLDIKFYIKVLNYFRIMSLVQKFIRGYDAAYTFLLHGTRVARWNISIPKIPIVCIYFSETLNFFCTF
jgi:hypothetical protein